MISFNKFPKSESSSYYKIYEFYILENLNLKSIRPVQILSSTHRRLSYAFLLALTLAACKGRQPQPQRLAPLPQDAFVQVYFNHSQTAEYTEPYRRYQRAGDDLERLIVDTIASARSTLDVAVQELRLPEIAKAIVERHKAGVKVRLILENNYSRPWSTFTPAEVKELPERESDRYSEFRRLVDINGDNELSPDEIKQRDALVLLRDAGIAIIDDTADGSKGSNLMHHKFVIVDGATVILTSANFTSSDIHGDFKSADSRGNANNLLKIDSSEVAASFTQEFNLMWGDGPAGKLDSKFGVKKPFRPARQVQLGQTTVTVQFSPVSKSVPWNQTPNGFIGKTLAAASQSINLALFVFSEQQLANILETSHQQGVEVRALIDSSFAHRSYSEGLDMMGVALGDNCKYEPNNRPWKNPITTVGVPMLPPGDLLHHKFAVVDDTTTIAGSHNWSDAANTGNDETVLVVQSPTVAAHFKREFERLYAGAQLGVPVIIQRRVQALQQQCVPAVSSQTPSQGKPVPSGSPLAISRQDKTQTEQRINLNTATEQELEALPGVGPKLAKQIVAARQQKPFTSVEDLDRVPGVGPKMLEKLRDRVTW